MTHYSKRARLCDPFGSEYAIVRAPVATAELVQF